MDVDELQSVQSRERQTDSLQQLRATFYQDAAEYIQRLESERDAAAERADDPWNSPEVSRLNDDINTAEDTVEAIYERRIGKIVKMASLDAAGMPTEDEGLTEEERTLFERLVGAIEQNREHVFAILDGEDPDVSGLDIGDPTPDVADTTPDDASGTTTEHEPAPPAPESGTADGAAAESSPDTDDSSRDDHPSPKDLAPEGVEPATGSPANGDGTASPDDVGTVDAADVMGSGSEAETNDRNRSEAGDADRTAPDGGARTAQPGDGGGPAPDTSPQTGESGGDADSENAESETASGQSGVDRATVKITDDVGEIFGVDERSYDLTSEDVVTLPEANAGPLLERGAAERLD